MVLDEIVGVLAARRGRAAEETETMKKRRWLVGALSGLLLMVGPVLAEKGSSTCQGRTIVTIMPAKTGQTVPSVPVQDLKGKVSGKEMNVTKWSQLRADSDPLELVILIDGSARTSLGLQLTTVARFIEQMPKNSKMAIAYMLNGRALFASSLSSDPSAVLRGLHAPMALPESNGSPYFSLSDLAKNWPSTDPTARREVLMITDGVDEYEMHYDPEDPYVQTAIRDSLKARLVVYAMYWTNRGWFDNTQYENDSGQNLLIQVVQATGGISFWQGMGNPVTLDPYFDQLRQILNNQYELQFTVPLKARTHIQSMKLQVKAGPVKVTAPDRVFVDWEN